LSDTQNLDNSVLNAGIACSWPAKMEDTKQMWVHHFFIFQHVLTNLCVRKESQLENYSEKVLPSPYKVTFYGDSWQTFFEVMDEHDDRGVERQGSLLRWQGGVPWE